MNTNDFTFLIDLIKERSGIVLSAEKGYLIESRLIPVAQRHGCSSVEELVTKLRGQRSSELAVEITEAMTTNESFFFRDKTPFEHLESYVLPALKKSRKDRKAINFWCAAASTGQEPYSISMVLKKFGPQLPNWKFKILGTDLSNEVLEKAKAGTYSQFEVQRGLPINLLVKWFKQNGEAWTLDPEIRAMVRYQNFNLLDSFTPLGKFDVVFLRNVLIYFDRETKKDILERMAAVMPEDGYLILGAAETVVGLTDAFRPVKTHRGLYERNKEFGKSSSTGSGVSARTSVGRAVRPKTAAFARTGR